MSSKREILCEYQPYVDQVPFTPAQLRAQAVSNDVATVESWRELWKKNIAENFKKFGSFGDHGVGKLWGVHRNLPGIVIGSGPSLSQNAEQLKENVGIPTISCLHNFHYLEDLGVGADYYCTLDAGPLVLEEVSEGGTKTADEYWAMTNGKKLIAYIGTDPRLFDLWQGEVYFFNAAVDPDINGHIESFEKFNNLVSTGGNVFGAAMYIAKAIFGCNPLIFMGASFSFSYLDKFHPWDSKYDVNLGQVVKMTDVYGNCVKTWTSYANFKAHFDWVAQMVPGLYINASEGGIFGAYPGGNIRHVLQMDLKDVFRMYGMSDFVKINQLDPKSDERKLLY